ncbi:hypothetical protein ACFFK0_06255 [Paenibacillus chartarius]|uniref:DUF4083 domain-containing protein n=1 Tax=Paenibacillus chartarius TaxID=747481 RepID=A0ABV6DHE1_9BACL
MTGVVQLLSLLMFFLTVYALISVINYVNWKKRHDIQMEKKLDSLLEHLDKRQ